MRGFGFKFSAFGAVAIFIFLLKFDYLEKYYKARCLVLTNIVVAVHGEKGRSDIVLQNKGVVIMEIAGKKERAAIGELGESHLQQLPIDSPATVFVNNADYFQVKYPDSVYIIKPNSKIFVEVYIPNQGNIYGKVLNNGKPIAGVRISIDTLNFYSDSVGRFTFNIPKANQKRAYTINFNKDGFDTFSDIVHTPLEEELGINLKASKKLLKLN